VEEDDGNKNLNSPSSKTILFKIEAPIFEFGAFKIQA
jgi:hypothetical protein